MMSGPGRYSRLKFAVGAFRGHIYHHSELTIRSIEMVNNSDYHMSKSRKSRGNRFFFL